MADFMAALKIGLDAAEQADKNRNEVESVLEELNKQLSSMTKDKVLIARYEKTNPLLALAALTSNEGLEKKMYLAAVSKVEKGQHTEIAKWRQERAGYPCTIEFGENEFYCADKIGLEEALALLLQDPIVGGVIYKYMQMPINKGQQ